MFRVNYIRESNIKKIVHNNGNILKQRKFIFTLKNFRLQHGRERENNLSGYKERHDILRFGRERIFLPGQPEVDAYAARLGLFHRRQKIVFFAETADFCGWFGVAKVTFAPIQTPSPRVIGETSRSVQLCQTRIKRTMAFIGEGILKNTTKTSNT